MKAFDLQQLIKDHVNRESNVEWALRDDRQEPPKVEKQPIPKLTAGLYNFIKYNILELRP